MIRRLTALAGALVVALLTAALLTPAVAGAAAENCHLEAVKRPDGSIYYVKVCDEVTPGQPGTPGGPSCDIAGMGAPMPGFSGWYCKGALICANRENIVPLAPPTTPAPPGQTWVREDCFTGPGTAAAVALVLSGTVARPLIVQAMEAFGNLDPPAGAVRHSPADKAVVRLETWLWLDGGSFGRLTGSSAEGLVAVAEPDTTLWRPGDGASLTCPGGGGAYGSGAQGCTHTYTRASAAYHGSVTRRWVVHYENGGAPVDIPGAPVELTATTDFALTVVETQVLTRD